MAIVSAKIAFFDSFFFLVETDEGKTLTVPNDMANRDRQALQQWLDAGNTLEPTESPVFRNWAGLSAAFKTCQVNATITALKDDGTHPKLDRIWRLSDDLTLTLTQTVFADSDRINSMNSYLPDLLNELKLGEVTISSSAKAEVVSALTANGFPETAALIEALNL